MNIIRSCALALPLVATSAVAGHCSVNFNYGVIIDPRHIRTIDKGITNVQITNNSQLFIHGREISLTDQQKDVLAHYSLGIREHVPAIVSIAIDGVDIGLKAVNKLVGGLTGENSESHQKLQENFDELHWRMRRRFNHSDDSYFVAPQDFNDFDEIFAGDFEKEIKEIVASSVGTILLAVGKAMTAQEEGEMEDRMANFDQHLSELGQEIELDINEKTKVIETKASEFCNKLIDLDESETKLQQAIPELLPYNLISTDNRH
ncbi:DUF2884 family protein [Thalassotalea sp. LPB0316]|uniref:DUF2884 family protein n=1 Tax=Thalassotalea sp. LPB0316 TaxID=2769490 RepID=UPI001D04C101|nr:DUF2884 family protein [Thalassotalea sp. LPB0316]